MLSLANVTEGGRYLVIDETGLLVAAILERGHPLLVVPNVQAALSSFYTTSKNPISIY
jgi:hypothetical protein